MNSPERSASRWNPTSLPIGGSNDPLRRQETREEELELFRKPHTGGKEQLVFPSTVPATFKHILPFTTVNVVLLYM